MRPHRKSASYTGTTLRTPKHTLCTEESNCWPIKKPTAEHTCDLRGTWRVAARVRRPCIYRKSPPNLPRIEDKPPSARRTVCSCSCAHPRRAHTNIICQQDAQAAQATAPSRLPPPAAQRACSCAQRRDRLLGRVVASELQGPGTNKGGATPDFPAFGRPQLLQPSVNGADLLVVDFAVQRDVRPPYPEAVSSQSPRMNRLGAQRQARRCPPQGVPSVSATALVAGLIITTRTVLVLKNNCSSQPHACKICHFLFT